MSRTKISEGYLKEKEEKERKKRDRRRRVAFIARQNVDGSIAVVVNVALNRNNLTQILRR